MKYTNNELISMYKTMVLGRIYDDVLWEENQKGRLYSMFHFSTGQEAIGTAAAHALRENEPFMPSHRCRPLHLHRLDIYKYLAEQVGIKDGYNMGISGDPHLTLLDKGFIPNPGVLGQGCPIATGFAFALKYMKTGKAMVQLMGDGTYNQGAVYEAMNWAVVQKLPIVYVVENNAFAMTTTQDVYVGTEALSDRAKGLGMDSITVNGNDILAMREIMDIALDRARISSTPTMIEAVTYRRQGHFAGDTADYRDKSFHEQMLLKHPDPILNYEKVLIQRNILTQDEMDIIKVETRKMITGACDMVYEKMQNPANKPSIQDIIKPEFTYASPMEGLI
ncbi:thiamine pyrophosphate-dependent dehydrogenase E1 component subunit alpha [Alkalibaculum sporogenes]|nr:thiamine pyrophosphate-dependent dehydrogenase E1 component subunit alpha [Alkalibaculum sporogenes]